MSIFIRKVRFPTITDISSCGNDTYFDNFLKILNCSKTCGTEAIQTAF